jgi:cation diffusion facilitator family transporter
MAAGAWDETRRATGRRKTAAVWLSLGSNTVAVVLKLILALVTGSTAILAEAAHTLSDLGASLIALFAVRKAADPADPSHPFGHEKFEHLSGVAEGAVIVAVSLAVIAASVLSFGDPVAHSNIGVGVMLGTAGLNLVVARRVARVGRETRSAALEAEAAHLRTDVATSLGAAAALVAVAVTDMAEFDQLVAVAIALFTAATGVRLISGGVRVLVDEAVPSEDVATIRAVLDAAEPHGVRGYHRLRARRSGSVRHIDLHLTVDETTSVGRAHEITDSIEAEIERRLPDADVVIHVEPHTHLHERDARLL